MVEELVGQAQLGHGRVDLGRAEVLAHAGADAADDNAVLERDDEPVLVGECDDALGHGHDPARVDHGDADALRLDVLRDLDRGARHRADGDNEHIRPAADAQHVDAVVEPTHGLDLVAHLALRIPQHGRAVFDGDRLAEFLAQSGRVARCGEPNARHDLQQRQVPHAVVTRPVRAGDASAIEHERDRRVVQANVHEHLIKRPVHECRVDRDDRVQAAERHAGRRGDCVLLGNADVVHALRVLLRQRLEPDRAQHCRGDAHDVVAFVGDLDQFVAEHRGPRLPA